jgi:hypothetical protein
VVDAATARATKTIAAEREKRIGKTKVVTGFGFVVARVSVATAVADNEN